MVGPGAVARMGCRPVDPRTGNLDRHREHGRGSLQQRSHAAARRHRARRRRVRRVYDPSTGTWTATAPMTTPTRSRGHGPARPAQRHGARRGRRATSASCMTREPELERHGVDDPGPSPAYGHVLPMARYSSRWGRESRPDVAPPSSTIQAPGGGRHREHGCGRRLHTANSAGGRCRGRLCR